MDFARKQLEKYGWCEGKGLGKAENGIQHAIKPKPKHGQGGIGHDIAEEFTNHWWQKVYNNAADNIEINKKENGEVENFSTKKGESINITTKTWVKSKRSKNKNLSTMSKVTGDYMDKFINRATLTNGVTLVENKKSENNDDSSDLDEGDGVISLPKIEKLTDEQLFSACGGRTAHKGARHGIKSNGKLSRINENEYNLLQKMKAIYKISEDSTNVKNKLNNCDKKTLTTHKDDEQIVSICKNAHLSSEQSFVMTSDVETNLNIIKPNKRKRKRCRVNVDSDSNVTIYEPQKIVQSDDLTKKAKKKKRTKTKLIN